MPPKHEPLTTIEVLMIVCIIGGLLFACALIAGKATA